ncbi:MAG: hypothetical protein R6W90_13865 [Ignavibacteriaceae bacterium]
MNKKPAIIFSCLMLISSSVVLSQEDPMVYQRWNIMDINRIRTVFTNMGMLGNGDSYVGPPRRPSFEYPNGSGVDYGRAVGVVVAAPGNQEPGAVGGDDNPAEIPYVDATFDEGPVPFWDPYHFAPFPEVVGSDKAPLSTDPETWPSGWPQLIPGTTDPLLVGSDGWPGFGPNGEIMADQETYTANYSWRGRKLTGTQELRRWLKTTLEMRGLGWTGQLYQDFLIWVYVVRNSGDAPITDMRMAVHSDFSVIPVIFDPGGGSAPNRHYYDNKLQLAWVIADNPQAVPNPLGAGVLQEPAVMGTLVLRMPGESGKVDKYSAYHIFEGATQAGGNGARASLYYRYNILNEDNPRSSRNDGFCDDFDMDGIPDSVNGGPGYFYVPGGQGAQTLSSGAFTLQPGESDTLIFATVFAKSREELFQNSRNAMALYSSGWKVEKAPVAPSVEVAPGNKQNTIYWGLQSENEPAFEGYKIYRSSDNGVTWGSSSITDFDGGIHYIPMAQFDKLNGILGNYTGIPKFAWYDLGDDTDLPPVHIVTSEDKLQFFKPGDSVRVFVDNTAINGLKYKYYVAAYDTGHGITGPLENTAASVPKAGTNTVEVVPQAGLSTAPGDLSQVRVVPNPYIVASGYEVGSDKIVQFTKLPASATIKIYNSAGELIRTIEHNGGGSLAPSIATWDLKNEDRQLVAPGLYFFYLDSPIGSTQGKFVIIL